jgi:protocatechuate 3,4-dioxygenase beta subunit
LKYWCGAARRAIGYRGTLSMRCRAEAAMPEIPPSRSRRSALRVLVRCAALPTLAAAVPRWPHAQTLAPTPACGADAAPTAAQMEGPYFRPRSPQRDSLVDPGAAGPRVTLTGRVLTTQCAPVARALVDLWHADAGGRYDVDGERWRGHVYTDAQGRYRFATIVPGLYPGRTRHFHVKVQPPGGRVLTTQLYFPGEPGNLRDGLYAPALEVAWQRGADRAAFDFVVAVS